MLRGRTLFLHGAEHRAISAAEQRHLSEAWHGPLPRPSRFAARCGTNFAAPVLPVAAVLDHLSPRSAAAYAPIVDAMLALALTMELWRLIQQEVVGCARWLLPRLAFSASQLENLDSRRRASHSLRSPPSCAASSRSPSTHGWYRRVASRPHSRSRTPVELA
ncbi:MAG: DUF1385 domain-containing protein [Gaiellaceae bacterium]